MKDFMRETSRSYWLPWHALATVLCLSSTMACQKEGSVTLEFGSAPRDYGATFSTLCGVESERSCRAIIAAGTTIEVDPGPSEPSESCPFFMTISESCDPGALTLLEATQDVAVFLDAEPVEVDFNAFDRNFDEDADAFSNYLEWAEQTDPRDAAVTPAPPGDLSP